MATNDNENEAKPSVSSQPYVSIYVPRFYKPDPAMFFINTESQFALAGITNDQKKYSHLTSNLDPEILSEVSNVLLNPTTRTYNDLKEVKAAIIKRFSQSEEQRLHKLLGNMELGDLQPSQLLRNIRILGPDVPESVVQSLWLKKLPMHKQKILQAVSVNNTLSEQAEVADKMLAVQNPSNIYAVFSPVPHYSCNENLSELSKKVDELSKANHEFQPHSRSQLRPRSPSPNKHRYCHIH